MRTRLLPPLLTLLTLLAALLAVALLSPPPTLAGAPPPPARRTAAVISGWRWPLDGPGGGPPPVVRRFQAPSTPYGPGHRGVDLAGPAGAPVHAAGPGVVAFAGPVAGVGTVSVQHEGGLRTTYQPVDVLVAAGQHLAAGDVVGSLLPGHPGCSAVAPLVCLHWGLRHGADYLDPLALFGRAHVRLLPHTTRPPPWGRGDRYLRSASLPRSWSTALV
ncbi:MAG: murein hydrolase activator EnvC family protein [Mycobacteriales bacterium]